MKKSLLFCLLVSTLLIFNNCSKVDAVLNTGILECKKDGSAWKSTTLSTFYSSVTSPAGSILTAISTDQTEIVIHLSDSFKVGTYPFDTISVFFATFGDTPKQKVYRSIDGLIQITEIDAEGKISGNFHFTGKEIGGTVTISFTEGRFTKVVKK